MQVLLLVTFFQKCKTWCQNLLLKEVKLEKYNTGYLDGAKITKIEQCSFSFFFQVVSSLREFFCLFFSLSCQQDYRKFSAIICRKQSSVCHEKKKKYVGMYYYQVGKHSSQFQSLCSMKSSGELLQNLPFLISQQYAAFYYISSKLSLGFHIKNTTYFACNFSSGMNPEIQRSIIM